MSFSDGLDSSLFTDEAELTGLEWTKVELAVAAGLPSSVDQIDRGLGGLI